MKIKPNNSWEIEWKKLTVKSYNLKTEKYEDEPIIFVNDKSWEKVKNFITKTLQQQREEILDNKKVEEIMMKIFKERKAELDVVKFKSNTRAFAVAGIDLIYNYMLEVIKILQSLKQENK